jgi:hypothetical protein
VGLESPDGDRFAAIRGAGRGGRAVLGMSMVGQLRGVVFDFTKGGERVGFIPREKVQEREDTVVGRLWNSIGF